MRPHCLAAHDAMITPWCVVFDGIMMISLRRVPVGFALLKCGQDQDYWYLRLDFWGGGCRSYVCANICHPFKKRPSSYKSKVANRVWISMVKLYHTSAALHCLCDMNKALFVTQCAVSGIPGKTYRYENQEMTSNVRFGIFWLDYY